MADALFEERRLARIYDDLDPDRADLEAYVQIVDELDARRVLDIGCGTGTFCCLLAQRGVEVIGVDPAAASLEVARTKPGADQVRWLHAEAADLLTTVSDDRVGVDLVTMTANVAQVFLTDSQWESVLRAAWIALRPGGHLVFETRDPQRQAWREWTRERSQRQTAIPEVGVVESWVQVTEQDGPLISFRWSFAFQADGVTMTSDSTLRFRDHAEIESSLLQAGFDRVEVRDAADRPGREFVVLARRPGPDGPS
jgi:SAM-dependent methyltransferase